MNPEAEGMVVQVVKKELVYKDDFKQFIREHPGVIATFKNLEHQIVDHIKESEDTSEYSIESDGVKVTVLDLHCNSHPDTPAPYVKVEADEHAYFVKRVPGYFGAGAGPQEFKSLQRARELLRDVKDVDVIDFQLGFNDGEKTSYFVSKWIEGLRYDDYISDLMDRQIACRDNEKRDELYMEMRTLESNFAEMERRLGGEFLDIEDGNVLYNPQTKKMIIFDMHRKKPLTEN